MIRRRGGGTSHPDMGISVDAGNGDWRDRAACRGVDPETFFPLGEKTGEARVQIYEAKKICRRCPVVEECLREALKKGDAFAVRGNTTPEERRRLRRKENRNKQPPNVARGQVWRSIYHKSRGRLIEVQSVASGVVSYKLVAPPPTSQLALIKDTRNTISVDGLLTNYRLIKEAA